MQRRHNLNPALRHNRALDAKTTISRIGGQMTQETVKNGTEALFTREGMPPVKEMIPCALQHVLASFAGIITPAVIMAGVCSFSSQQKTDIIQVALILSAIDTALQAFAPFRRIGGGHCCCSYSGRFRNPVWRQFRFHGQLFRRRSISAFIFRSRSDLLISI